MLAAARVTVAHPARVIDRGLCSEPHGHPGRVTPDHPSRCEIRCLVSGDRYEIRVKGSIGEPLLDSFEGLEGRVRPAETILRGQVTDQPALHGILDRIQALGLELIEVKRVDDPAD
jgi:hypothetical protein